MIHEMDSEMNEEYLFISFISGLDKVNFELDRYLESNKHECKKIDCKF